MNAFAALALARTPTMTVHSDLLGTLEVEPDDLIEMPAGLFGLPECRSFALIAADREGLYWLQSAEHSALAFLLADPFLFFDDYEVDVPPAELQELRVQGGSDVAVFAIVTLPRSPGQSATANLQGPLAVNLTERVGKQLALSDPDRGVRCPLDLMRPGPRLES